MRVSFWAASADGSSWYRTDQSAAALAWRGHSTWASQILPVSRRRPGDVIVGSRVANPAAMRFWRELRDRGRNLLVLDLDDNYFAIEPDNPAYSVWHPGSEAVRGLRESIGLSHRVVCTTQLLADAIREHTQHPDVRVVPNGLHAGMLAIPRTFDKPTITIGWAGTQDTVRNLHLAKRALNRIASYRPAGGEQLRLLLVGCTPELAAGQGLDLAAWGDRVRYVEWAEPVERYHATVATFDIQVAPYLDTPYNRGKFPTKALEAAFLGVPLIASVTGPFARWVEDAPGACGVALVGQEHEWGSWLRRAVDSRALREGLSQSARANAAGHTLQGAVGDAWEAALS